MQLKYKPKGVATHSSRTSGLEGRFLCTFVWATLDSAYQRLWYSYPFFLQHMSWPGNWSVSFDRNSRCLLLERLLQISLLDQS